MLRHTYWNHNGLFQTAAKTLNTLIPVEGSVPKPRSTNKSLERFRRACNVYHDLYNNGLMNRASEFRSVTGIVSSNFKRKRRWGNSFDGVLYERTERLMDRIVREAAVEQGIDLITGEQA
ncbi:MAG: hypothetical protein LC650_03360 [Actinobacteria bacterium]|nr:hypothetical protein [Actinomycetota bacterium]